MCGIVGIYLKNKKFEKNLGKMLSGMLNNMESRGPDSAGFAIYKDESKKLYKFSLCINDLNFNIFKKEIVISRPPKFRIKFFILVHHSTISLRRLYCSTKGRIIL